MPESLPGLIKGNLFWAGGWERKETVGHGSSIAMHWAEPACAPRAKPCRGNRECWKPRGLNREGWPLRTSCAPQTSVSATLLRQTEWRCPGLGPANSCAITEPSKLGTNRQRDTQTQTDRETFPQICAQRTWKLGPRDTCALRACCNACPACRRAWQGLAASRLGSKTQVSISTRSPARRSPRSPRSRHS